MEQVPLGKQLKSVSNLFSRHLNQIPLYHEGENLTPMQRMIIVVVHEKSQTQDVFQRDLEKFFSIRRSTVTGEAKVVPSSWATSFTGRRMVSGWSYVTAGR